MAIHPEKATTMAFEKNVQLREGFQKLLKEHGIEGWHLTAFNLEPTKVKVQPVAACPCPPGTTFDCRLVNGTIVCDCFPDAG
jgi:hypothetical protein